MENCVQSKIREKISHINNSEEQLYMMAKQPRDNNTNSRFDTTERNTAKKEQREKKSNCTHSTKGGKRIVAKFEMRIQKTKQKLIRFHCDLKHLNTNPSKRLRNTFTHFKSYNQTHKHTLYFYCLFKIHARNATRTDNHSYTQTRPSAIRRARLLD